MSTLRGNRVWTGVLCLGCLTSLVLAQDPDPVQQREQQKRIQGRVAEVARRASSTLDAMTYQRLSPTLERKMLEEVARGLQELSQEQIQQVLQYLEAAVAAQQAGNPQKVSESQQQAYAKQREIISQLRSMLIKLDLIRNLDEAAARLDAAAEKQLALNAETLATARLPRRGVRRFGDDRLELANEQQDLRTEINALFKQIENLIPHLSPQQKDRLERAEFAVRSLRLLQELQGTIALVREGQWELATDRQRRHAKELKDLAHALRTPPSDSVAALKTAQEKLQRAIDAQKKVQEQTQEPANPEQIEQARRQGVDPNLMRGHELANAQARAEFAARDARKAAEDADPEVANLLKPVENQQWKAEDALRQGKLDEAQPPQQQALNKLQQAKAEIDRRIAAAEQAKVDPRAAVEQAAQRLDKLIQQQKDAQGVTQRAEKNPDRLPLAQALQKETHQNAQQLQQTPLPPNPAFQQALQQATEAMQQAQNKLDAQDARQAQTDQQQALQALERAKKALEHQLQAIDQRREDIARLEELKNQLEELAKNERDIAEKAQKAEQPQQNRDLAQKQEQLQAPTNKAQEQLQQMAERHLQAADPQAAQPLQKAAEAVQQAQQNQQQARENLQKNQPQQAAQQAQQAADKLQQAARNLQDQLNQKRGEEANDQAALQPQRLDPNNAAQQLQQAIEQAQQAAQQAQQANHAQHQAQNAQQQPNNPQQQANNNAQQQPNNNAQPNLAELQKQLARDAQQQQLPQAAQAAEKAAQDLEQGNLPQAIKNQQKALDELNQAAQKQQANNGQQQAGQQQANNGQQQNGQQGNTGQQQQGNMGQQQAGQQGNMGQQPGQQGAAQLAQRQQQLLEAARALQQSQQANNAAQAALQQAQANTPMSIQNQLQQAQQQLQQAAQQLQQGQPAQAAQNQQQAAQQLQQALQALQAAQQQAQSNPGQQAGQQPGQQQANMGQQPGQQAGQQPGQQQATMGQQPGQQAGQQPGQQQANSNQPNQQPGPGRPNNPTISEGDQNGDEKLNKAGSNGNLVTGDGSFIQLRSKERERVQQGADARLPAEFRELIKLFNMNIKNAKPTTSGGNK